MLNLIVAGIPYIFPTTRVIKLIRGGVIFTNSTNPLIFTKNVTLVFLDCCTPPPVRLVAQCVAAGSLIATTIVSPNPLTLRSAIHIITEIYEIC